MKKLKNLSEGAFLKLLFAFVGVVFLVAAFCMPDRSTVLAGFWQTGSCQVCQAEV